MKEIITEFMEKQGKAFLLQLLVTAVVLSIYFYIYGKTHLIIGVVEGYLVTAIYIWILVYRVAKLEAFSLRKAKMQMWYGLILRIGAILLIVKFAMSQSAALGYTVLAVFIWGFFLFLINLIIYNYKHV